MQRIKLCGFILLFLVLISVGSLFLMNRKCEQLMSQAEQIMICWEEQQRYQENLPTEQQNPSAASIQAAEGLKTCWLNSYPILNVLVNQNKLSELNASVARILPFLLESSDELPSELQSILYQLQLLRQTEFPYVYNIF